MAVVVVVVVSSTVIGSDQMADSKSTTPATPAAGTAGSGGATATATTATTATTAKPEPKWKVEPSVIERAAKAIWAADAILFTSGAGLGVDGGLPDFRGPEGFWKA